jgi:hypothetical protein
MKFIGLLNIPLLCFIVINSIMSDSATPRDKPPRKIVKTPIPESPRVKPDSPKKEIPTIVPINDDVGEKIIVKTETQTARLIYDDSSGTDNVPLSSVTNFRTISLTPTESDSSDDYEKPPPKLSRSPIFKKTRRKHKTKTRTMSFEPEMTELSNITETDGDGIKNQLVNISKGLMDSVKDNIEDLYIDRKKTAKKATVGTIGSFVIIVVMICMIVLIKKI